MDMKEYWHRAEDLGFHDPGHTCHKQVRITPLNNSDENGEIKVELSFQYGETEFPLRAEFLINTENTSGHSLLESIALEAHMHLYGRKFKWWSIRRRLNKKRGTEFAYTFFAPTDTLCVKLGTIAPTPGEAYRKMEENFKKLGYKMV
jgi:hypothetical protein